MLVDDIKKHPEAAMAFVAKLSLEREIESWPSDEELDTNPLYQPSADFDNKIKKLVSRVNREKKWKEIRKHCKKAMIALLTFTFLISCSLVTAKAVQQAVISTVIEWKDEFVQLIFSQNDSESNASLQTVSIEYWPDGYTQVIERKKLDTLMVEIRQNDDEQIAYIKIDALKKDAIKNLDNALSIHTKIEYEGRKLYWSVSETDVNSIVFSENGFLVTISAQESLDELLKISENVKF